VRYWVETAFYEPGDFVVNGAEIWRAEVANGPGMFNPAQWAAISGMGGFLPLTGGTLTGPLNLSGLPTLDAHATSKAYVDDFYLPLTAGVTSQLTGPLYLPQPNPTLPVHAAHKAYVDAGDMALQDQIALLTSNLIFVGGIDVPNDDCTFTTASGMTNGPLPGANPSNANRYLIVTNGGAAPASGSNIPPGQYSVGDWIISSGTAWVGLPTGQTGVIALNVGITPPIGGLGPNVQTGLAWLDDNKVDLAGDTMTGLLTLSELPSIPGGDPGDVITTDGAGGLRWLPGAAPPPDLSGYLPLTGGTMEGGLTLQSAMPTGEWDAAPKSYVDGYLPLTDPIVSNAPYLRLLGGTLTGGLTIQSAGGLTIYPTIGNANIALYSPGITASAQISVGDNIGAYISLIAAAGIGQGIGSAVGNNSRWRINLSDGSPETGGLAGSNFSIVAYQDGGGGGLPLSTPLAIERATGVTTLSAIPSIPGGALGLVLSTDGAGTLSWTGVLPGGPFLPLAAGLTASLTGPLYLQAAAPTLGPMATNKTYVDGQDQVLQDQITLLSSNLLFVGGVDVPNDDCFFTASSGLGNGVLPAPGSGNANFYVIVIAGGAPPATGSEIPADTYSQGDWIVSTGQQWIRLPNGQPNLTANDIAIVPTIGTLGDDVQEGLAWLDGNKMPSIPGGDFGDVLTNDGAGGLSWEAPSIGDPVYGDVGNTNFLINGDMKIDQRNNGVIVNAPSGSGVNTVCYVDRWLYRPAQTGTQQIGRLLSNAAAIGNAVSPPGFPYCLNYNQTGAATSDGNSNISQLVEADSLPGLLWGTANAQPVTLSFWALRGPIPTNTTFGGAIRSVIVPSATGRCLPFNYSLPLADTWYKIVITIPGDTAGTWTLAGNGTGLQVCFALCPLAAQMAPPGAWATGNFVAANGSSPISTLGGARLCLTGVKLESGSVATPFTRETIAKSVIDCQRYFQRIAGFRTASRNWQSSVVQYDTITFPTMRAAPVGTFVFNASVPAGNANWTFAQVSSNLNTMTMTEANSAGITDYAVIYTINLAAELS
jgi:hypothetical protein